MSIIKVKRKTGNPDLSTDKLLEGEIGLVGDYFAWGPNTGGTNEVGIAVAAVQNKSNVFSQDNSFEGGDLELKAVTGKKITFVDSDNKTKYTFGATGKFTTTYENFESPDMLVSKAYVDAKVQGLNIKKSVKAASTSVLGGNLDESNTRFTLTASGKLTLDGVSDFDVDDRVLIKNQPIARQNGIYLVEVIGGTGVSPVLKRANDANTPEKLRAAFVFVEEGDTQADTGWNCITDTALLEDGEYEWVQFSGAGAYTGDEETIARNGTVFSLAKAPGLSVLGVPSNTQGKPEPIEAGTDGYVLRRNGTSLAFGTLPSGAFANNTISYSRLVNSNVGGFLGHSGTSSSAITMISSQTAGHVPVIGSNSTLSFGTVGNSSISTNANIAFSKLAAGSAYSVLGVAGDTAASVASIAAGTNTVLRRGSSGNLGFGKITHAHIDEMTSSDLASIINDEDVTGTGNLVFATSPTLTTPDLGAATATSINKVSITTPGTSAGIVIKNDQTLTIEKSLTFDASSSEVEVNFLSGGDVAYTGGKLNQFASTTSAELRGIISDETGSGKLVFATSPTFTTSVLGSQSMEVFNTGSTTVNAFGAATTLSIGHNSTVGTSSTEIAPGALVSGAKYVGIGTGGTGTSSTSIYIGPSYGSIFNTNINGVLVTSSEENVSGTFYRQDTVDIPTEASKLKYAGWLYATKFEGLIDGGVWT